MDYWLLVRDPHGVRTAAHLGDVDPGDAHLLAAVRRQLGVPQGDPIATRWDVQLTHEEPHGDWLGNVVGWSTAAIEATPATQAAATSEESSS